MAFIVKKKIHGKNYYYLNENKRVEGKVKSKTLAYLGKTKKEAEKKSKEIIQKLKEESAMELNQGTSNETDKKPEGEELLKRQDISIEDLTTFCKRKGFVYQSGDIYGGFAGFWDFGPLGVELKNNLKEDWWNYFVGRDDVVGIDGSIITHPKIWKASGHVDSFSDVFILCKKCKKPGKVDRNELGKVNCAHCGGDYDESTARDFKLMFETNVGQDDTSYLRPETAQMIFVDFKSVYDNSRAKLPFGIAQIGKAFRNEIAPRDFLFRSREFEQMEMQYFINPEKLDDCPFYEDIKNEKINILDSEKKEDVLSIGQMLKKKIFRNKWHAYWLHYSYLWFLKLGIDKDNLRLREHEKDELAHYANAAVDIEYNFPTGWREIFGSHDRGDFDLSQHEEFSRKELKVFDEESKKKVLPKVIESSFGVERAFLAFMFDSYFYGDQRKNIVLKLNPVLSPIKAAVFPIVKVNEEIVKISKDVYDNLRKEFSVVYDSGGSVGRRYSRNDEIGTPFCITVDEKSLKSMDVTIRDRDSKKQIRVKVSELKNVLRGLINGEINFDKVGKVGK
ncbi:MAG: glycine--tRNA ligase [Candidatus Pacearchaeota archaeon]